MVNLSFFSDKHSIYMVEYNCPKCNKIFKKKYNYEKHIYNRKKMCSNKIPCKYCKKYYSSKSNLNKHLRTSCKVYNRYSPKLKSTERICCKYCNKMFSNKTNMYRHVREYCKEKTEKKLLLEQIEHMKNEINKLKYNNDHNIVNNGTINNNNVHSNTTYNVNIVSFGDEDKSFIKCNELRKICSKGFYCIPEFVKTVHFNEQFPENHNVYISNMRDNHILVLNNNQWILCNKNETLSDIFENSRSFLSEKYDKMIEIYENNDTSKTYRIPKFERFNDEIDNHPKKKKEILDEVKLMLYNERNMVFDNIDQQNKLC